MSIGAFRFKVTWPFDVAHIVVKAECYHSFIPRHLQARNTKHLVYVLPKLDELLLVMNLTRWSKGLNKYLLVLHSKVKVRMIFLMKVMMILRMSLIMNLTFLYQLSQCLRSIPNNWFLKKQKGSFQRKNWRKKSLPNLKLFWLSWEFPRKWPMAKMILVVISSLRFFLFINFSLGQEKKEGSFFSYNSSPVAGTRTWLSSNLPPLDSWVLQSNFPFSMVKDFHWWLILKNLSQCRLKRPALLLNICCVPLSIFIFVIFLHFNFNALLNYALNTTCSWARGLGLSKPCSSRYCML